MALESFIQTRGTQPPDNDQPPVPTTDNSRPRIVASEEILNGNTELLISHGDGTYRLRRTRSGKLYLVK